MPFQVIESESDKDNDQLLSSQSNEESESNHKQGVKIYVDGLKRKRENDYGNKIIGY